MRTNIKKLLVFVLTFLAIRVLRKYKPQIIGVTGNVGKTSLKDMLFAGLSPLASVRQNQKSFNNEWGVPLTILGRPSGLHNPFSWLYTILLGVRMILFRQEYPRILILELGADHPSDIESIVKWLSPTDGCITRLPEVPVHLEFFGSREALVREKAALARVLPSEGVLILNADDADVLALSSETRAQIVSYGFSAHAQIRGKNFKYRYTTQDGVSIVSGSQMDIILPEGEVFHIETACIQKNLMGLVLATVAYAYARQYPVSRVVEALSGYVPSPGRGRLISGKGGALIIDESYSASPVAVETALETLGSITTSGKKIALLGDMHELGTESLRAHRALGKIAAQNVDILVTVGDEALQITNLAFAFGLKKDAIFCFDTPREAAKYIAPLLQPGDIVLCKGAPDIRMEKAVRFLMAEPRHAERLLVRQEWEWRGR